jgi:8-oxo-dGTP pyrophosphatase MutT (NUDIX family)
VTHDQDPIGNANLGAACAMFDEAGRVLLVRHTYGKLNWEIPGGNALPDEHPQAVAARELQEETGLIVSGGLLTGVYYEHDHWSGPMLHFVFRFSAPAEQRAVARPPEISEVGWFTLDALPVPISDFTERRIGDALADTPVFGVVGIRIWRE